MNEIILHHYPTSPFSEKVRVALGIKKLAWHSVHIPVIMPKPELMPLTGGYRKTPVMQIGADIYCDTQCILHELERRFPEPSLYRGTDAGIATALAFWTDRSLFSPAVGLSLGTGTRPLPQEFLDDRAKFTGRELDIPRLTAAAPLLVDQLRVALVWYENTLADGRAFLFGDAPTIVDCALYHPCWFLRRNLGEEAAPLSELSQLRKWFTRVEALGHGQPKPMTPSAALDIAAAATPQTQVQTDTFDPFGRKPGDRVQVVPDDTGRDPVIGELVALSSSTIAIARDDARVGRVIVHFPRAGFVVRGT